MTTLDPRVDRTRTAVLEATAERLAHNLGDAPIGQLLPSLVGAASIGLSDADRHGW
jgi:hypothetical protein